MSFVYDNKTGYWRTKCDDCGTVLNNPAHFKATCLVSASECGWAVSGTARDDNFAQCPTCRKSEDDAADDDMVGHALSGDLD